MTILFEDVVAHKIGFVDDIDIDQAATMKVVAHIVNAVDDNDQT